MALTEQSLTQSSPEILGLERQRKLADLLTSQAFTQPQGQMVSGYYVAPSWSQQLAPMASLLAGNAISERADKQQADLAAVLRGKSIEETKKIIELAKTNPEAALALASNAETSQARAFAPTLMQNYLPKKTDKLIEYDTYKQEGGNLPFSEWVNRLTPEQEQRLALDRQRLGLENERIRIEREKLAQEMGGAKLTETQSKATNFGIQMAGSMQEMKAVEKAGFDPGTTKNQAMLSVAGSKIGNAFVSPEAQRYKQAMDNFTENYIRFKSGANVPMHEIEKDLKNMMPEIKDTQDKLEQKQRARERAIQGMSISAGPGYRYINEAYNTTAPGMLNSANKPTQTTQTQQTPSLWGKATVVGKE